MLEFSLHQGTSLYGRAPHDALRLISVAAAPDGHTLEILWAMCTHLQHLGYPTVVLDGSATETAEAPGLVDLLDRHLWIEAPLTTHPPSEQSLAVLPAARGLAALSAASGQGSPPLHRLQPLLRRYAVVVLYAPVGRLCSNLMEGCATSPLVLLAEGDDAIMQTYADLKWLALHAGLTATVASLARSPQQHSTAPQRLRVLSECAGKHLEQVPRTLALDAKHPADLERLALDLLENAEILAPSGLCTALPSPRGASNAPHYATSH